MKNESRTRQVQLVQRQSLADAFRLKAGAKGISVNEAANQAIQQYIDSGGENIEEGKTRRLMLLIPQSMHDTLTEMAKAQGISVNKAVEHAMEAYVTGEQTENTRNRLTYYISEHGKIKARLDSIVSAVNQGCGGIQALLTMAAETAEKKVSKSREPERLEQLRKSIAGISKAAEEMRDQVNDLGNKQ